MATYLSMHIIACMTRQALNELMGTLQQAPDITFIRASASQMAGRLLCEFEAPDQETLLRFLEAHHVTYEWIIRVEMHWEGDSTTTAPAAVASPAVTSPTMQPSPAPQVLEEGQAATILHILRQLQDESAWEIIQAQRGSQSMAVLLMHDAVLAPPPLEVPMYACDADVQARGLSSALPLLTYDQIIDLIFACKRVMVW